MRASDSGPLDELQANYGHTREIEDFTFIKENKPSMIFKAKV